MECHIVYMYWDHAHINYGWHLYLGVTDNDIWKVQLQLLVSQSGPRRGLDSNLLIERIIMWGHKLILKHGIYYVIYVNDSSDDSWGAEGTGYPSEDHLPPGLQGGQATFQPSC